MVEKRDNGVVSWPWLGPVLVTVCLGLIGVIFQRQSSQIDRIESERAEDHTSIKIQQHDIDDMNYKLNKMLDNIDTLNSKIDELNMRWAQQSYQQQQHKPEQLQRQFDK